MYRPLEGSEPVATRHLIRRINAELGKEIINTEVGPITIDLDLVIGEILSQREGLR